MYSLVHPVSLRDLNPLRWHFRDLRHGFDQIAHPVFANLRAYNHHGDGDRLVAVDAGPVDRIRVRGLTGAVSGSHACSRVGRPYGVSGPEGLRSSSEPHMSGCSRCTPSPRRRAPSAGGIGMRGQHGRSLHRAQGRDFRVVPLRSAFGRSLPRVRRAYRGSSKTGSTGTPSSMPIRRMYDVRSTWCPPDTSTGAMPMVTMPGRTTRAPQRANACDGIGLSFARPSRLLVIPPYGNRIASGYRDPDRVPRDDV